MNPLSRISLDLKHAGEQRDDIAHCSSLTSPTVCVCVCVYVCVSERVRKISSLSSRTFRSAKIQVNPQSEIVQRTPLTVIHW